MPLAMIGLGKTGHDADAITKLETRFRSRQDESYSAKILAAVRNEFGGHAVKKS